jgi:hypothetical protein
MISCECTMKNWMNMTAEMRSLYYGLSFSHSFIPGISTRSYETRIYV